MKTELLYKYGGFMNNEKYGYDTIIADKGSIARMKKYAKDHGIKMYRAVGSAINDYLDNIAGTSDRVNNYEERKREIPMEAKG
jgi:predicted Fe-Mo cluster-binding NifX family protein